MDNRTALEYNRAKLLWLQEKVAIVEHNIRVLEGLQDDSLDDVFEAELRLREPVQTSVLPDPEPVSATTEAPQLAVVQHLVRPPLANAAWLRRPRQLPKDWIRLLSFIGVNGKKYAEVVHFLQENGVQISPETARAGLMNYRKQFGLVENPKRGFYRLSDHGAEIIAALKNESPATSSSEASEPQPTLE